jgi:hypothetical protein
VKTDDIETLWEWIDDPVESEIISKGRWATTHRAVFKHADGKYYYVDYDHLGDEGIDRNGPWEAIEVKQVLTTITTWEPV